MKFIDLINEDFTPDSEQLKELKRAKAVYVTYKKGAVIFMHYSNRGKDEKDNIVKYKLGEPEYKWYPKNGNKNDMYLSVQVKNLTVYIKDPVLYDALVNPKRMQDYYMPLIYNFINPKAVKRFEKHKVKLHIGEPKVEFVLVEPKEPQAINEELTNKDIKKCEVLWDQFKTGTFIMNDKKYRYQLRNEYQIISVPSNPNPIIEIQGTFENSVRVYEMQDNGHNILLDYEINNRLYMDVKSKVRKKFNNYNVHLSL